MNLIEKIDFLCKEQGLSRRQFSIKANIPYTTIDGLFKRGYEGVRLSTFISICDFFQVTMDSMARDNEQIVYLKDLLENDLTIYDSKLLNEYHNLSPEGKERVNYTLKAELELTAALEKKDVQVG